MIDKSSGYNSPIRGDQLRTINNIQNDSEDGASNGSRKLVSKKYVDFNVDGAYEVRDKDSAQFKGQK